MSFLGWMDRSGRSGANPDAGPAHAEIQERRRTTSSVVCAGTLACQECDAPIALGGTSLSLADELTCPFCRHAGPVREFLSLATPTRPAHVVVRMTRPASGGQLRHRL